jgi:exopolyphosphatase / guanosine-5'-triphosphate,3'-diphosphate pyrophosphatase
MNNASLLAAVDLGSNSCRLEIGRIESGQLVRVDYIKEMVRLGGGLDRELMLSEAAMQRALECLARFGERLRGFARQQVRAVATQTLREAKNRDEFLKRAIKALGFPIEVIAGREEARLIYSGVSHLLPDSRERRLVVDIGGRSTELILGKQLDPEQAESFKVGSVSMSMRFFVEGNLQAKAFDNAVIAACAEFEEAQELFHASQWDSAYGSSGTIGAIAEILRLNGVAAQGITAPGLTWCKTQLLAAGHIKRLQIAGLKEDRKPVIAGGLAVLTAVFETFEIEQMQAADGALRQGVLFDLIGRREERTDVRTQTVQRLQQRFGVDVAQAHRVEAAALMLYAQIAARAEDEERRMLTWACGLHELGMAVSHSEFHKHGAYIIANADAAGFSQPQSVRLADLVLAHRGGLRKVEPRLSDAAFVQQLVCLRLAALLAHARRPLEKKAVQLLREDQKFVVHINATWASKHPQSVYLLQEEAECWRKSGWTVQLKNQYAEKVL